jgi:peroxiredoxin
MTNFFKIPCLAACLLAFTFFLIRCSGKNEHIKNSITGNIAGAADQKIVLEEATPKCIITIDDVVVDAAGNFSFDVQPDETGFYLLRFENGGTIKLVMHPKDRISIDSDTASIPHFYEIEGNEDSRILQHYFSQTFNRQQKFDSLRDMFFESRHLDDFHLIKAGIDAKLEQLNAEQREFTLKTVRENPGSIASLLLLNQHFAGRLLSEIENDFNLFVKVDRALMQKYPENSHVLAHHRKVLEFQEALADQQLTEERLAPGQPIPDISLQTPENKIIKLSSLRGQPVILYFWVSWSPPCRAANHQLKELYAQYHPDGLEIYAVALDHQKRFWTDAIKVDNLPWINVSDLQGMSSPVMTIYNLPEALPYFILIDEEGRIVKKANSFSNIIKAVDNWMKNRKS